jgi:hypothetical protein
MLKTHNDCKESRCKVCQQPILPVKRASILDTCITCGAREAALHRFTVVPMHKSNYTVVSNRADLCNLNPKKGA